MPLSSLTFNPSPISNPKATLTYETYRITILTSSLFRIENAYDKRFKDESTLLVKNRYAPTPPDFKITFDGVTLQIVTDYAVLKIQDVHQLWVDKADNVKVTTKSTNKTWVHGLNIDDPFLQQNVPGYFNPDWNYFSKSPITFNCMDTLLSGEKCEFGLFNRWGLRVLDQTGYSYNSVLDSNKEKPNDIFNQFGLSTNLTDNFNTSCYSIKNPLSCGESPLSQSQCIDRGCCMDSSTNNCYYGAQTHIDLYFFAHGNDYTVPLQDLIFLTTPPPMLPKFAFGVWYATEQHLFSQDVREIVNDFDVNIIPLDVFCINKSWHLTFEKDANAGVLDGAGFPKGSTGFTWDHSLIPYPDNLVFELKNKFGIHFCLGNNFGSGIQPWEKTYDVFANHIGWDTKTNQFIPLDVFNSTYMDAFDKYILDSIEAVGIDFWWNTGESAPTSKNFNADPSFVLDEFLSSRSDFTISDLNFWHTPLLNLLNSPRPNMLMTKWNGIGSHMHYVMSMGKMKSTWVTLANQVALMISASNLAVSHVSGSIGGYYSTTDLEFFIRSLQLGLYSPILQIFTQKYYPSYFPSDMNIRYRSYMIHLLRERASLLPYLYTHAQIYHTTGLPIVRPIYTVFPLESQAFSTDISTSLYFFGSSLLVAPITSKGNSCYLSEKIVWIPEGLSIYHKEWGTVFNGPKMQKLNFLDKEIPVFGIAGASVVSRRYISFYERYSQSEINALGFDVYAGGIPISIGKNTTHNPEIVSYVYDDKGDGLNYQTNMASSYTFLQIESSDTGLNISISCKVEKLYEITTWEPASKFYLAIHGMWPAKSGKVAMSGKTFDYIEYTPDFLEKHTSGNYWMYDGTTLSLYIVILSPDLSSDTFSVNVETLSSPHHPLLGGGLPRIMARALETRAYLKETVAKHASNSVFLDDVPVLTQLSTMGTLLTRFPERAMEFASQVGSFANDAYGEIQISSYPDSQKQCALSWLGAILN